MGEDISWLADRLNGTGKPVLIDGGMGTELEKAGVPMDGQVWSGRAVLSHPHAVRNAHEAFIVAGAEVIIANTFASARHFLEPGGLGEQVININQTAVELALQARDRVASSQVAIAGSICEWAPTEDSRWHTVEAVAASTREQAEILVESGVDFLALEMCEDIPFSVAAIEAAFEFDLPVWIGMSAKTHPGASSLSVFDSRGMPFDALAERLASYPAMVMNVMHTPVTDVDEALEMVRRFWSGPVGVYPESGYFIMPKWQFVDIITPEELVEHSMAWINGGVRLVGGCCGLGPEHIAALRQALE